MTPERNVERVLEHWLVDGVDTMPDRVYLTILDRVERQPQRPAWRLRSWRFLSMPTPIRLAAIGAALLIVLVGGAVLLGGGSARTPAPTPTPIATAAPTPSPSPLPNASPTSRPATGQVQGDPLRFTYTTPPDWTTGGWAFTTASGGYAGPTGIGVAASGAVNVPADPCDGIGRVSDAKTAENVLADLRARDDLVVSNPADVTLGGLSGIRVDVALPADLSACSDLYMVWVEPDGSGFHAQGPSNLLDVWILEAPSGPIWVQIEHFAGTPAEDYAAAQALVASIVFTP